MRIENNVKPSVKILFLLFFQVVYSFSETVKNGTFEMVAIPAGKLEPFWQSSLSSKKNKISNPADKTKWLIPIKRFETMISQVTVGQFETFLEKNPEWKKENVPSLYTDDSYLKSIHSENKLAPITWVSWFAAKAYCGSLKMRLPTINEWEFMAQASETKKSAFKDKLFLKRILDWYGEPQNGNLKTTKSIYKNVYGVWDLHGLVWEWTEDFNSIFVTGESREDTSFNKDLFCGAGGMNSNDQENYSSFMRFAFRSSLKAKSSIWNLGFRCVK